MNKSLFLIPISILFFILALMGGAESFYLTATVIECHAASIFLISTAFISFLKTKTRYEKDTTILTSVGSFLLLMGVNLLVLIVKSTIVGIKAYILLVFPATLTAGGIISIYETYATYRSEKVKKTEIKVGLKRIFKEFDEDTLKIETSDSLGKYCVMITMQFDVNNGVGSIFARKYEKIKDWKTDIYDKSWTTSVFIPEGINDYFEEETQIPGTYQLEISLYTIKALQKALEKGENIEYYAQEYFEYEVKQSQPDSEEDIEVAKPKKTLLDRTEILQERMEEMEVWD